MRPVKGLHPFIFLHCYGQDRSVFESIREMERLIGAHELSFFQAVRHKRHISLPSALHTVKIQKQAPSPILQPYSCGRFIEPAFHILHAFIEGYHALIGSCRIFGPKQDDLGWIALALNEHVINAVLLIDGRIDHAAVLFLIQKRGLCKVRKIRRPGIIDPFRPIAIAPVRR